ncbi:MAG: hypothetical protein ACJ716_03815, partial [Marmoricola sp.]
MRQLVAATAGLLMIGTILAPGLESPAATQPAPLGRQGLVVEPQSGREIYTHTGPFDYRTGPALVRDAAGVISEYSCGPGPDGRDLIRYH